MKNRKGSTFVEIIVATIVFAVVMAFGLSFFTFSNKTGSMAKRELHAQQFAKDHIERMKEDLHNNNLAYIVSTTSSTVALGVTYNLTRTVANITSPVGKTVTVTVQWTDHGVSRSITMNDILYDKFASGYPTTW